MKQTNININEIKRFPTVTNPIKADDLHTCKVYQYSPARCIVTDYTDEQRADLLEMTKGRETADGIVFASSKYVLNRLHSWQNHEAQKQRAAILGEGWEYVCGLHHHTKPGDLVTCTDGTRGRVTKSDPESCCIEFETEDGQRLSVAGYFRYTPSEKSETAAQVKSMTKAFVAYTLGTESTWKPGDKVTFQFLFRNCNSAWEATLTRESEDYASFVYCLKGRQLTFEGHEPEHPATWGRRYYTMEKAFLHILNHFNENVNIRNHYTDVWQWLDEGNRTESWI